MVPLGDLLTKSEESTEIRPDCRYKQVTVRLWGEGVAERNEVSGAEIAGARRRVVRRGQLLLSRIDARNGAFGIVPDNLDGAVVSNDFPAFRLQPDHVVPAYLGWLSKTHAFVALCGAASEGTTNRVRLKQDRFLAMTIPLPPLSEQHRIVGRIEELAAKVREARDLRRETLDTAESLLAAEELRIWPKEQLRGAPHLGDITVFLARGRQSRQGESEHYLIKTQHVQMGRYVRSEIRLDPDVAVKVAPEATVKQGDVLIACSAAGCLGRVAYYTDTDRVASTDTHVAIARADCRVIAPEYLYAYLKGAQGQLQLRSRERGDWRREKVGFRLTELNLADLKRVPVPVPSLSEQRLIVGYLDDLREKVDALRRLQRETAAELDAMLPSILDKAFKGEL
jgi:type I restriction enzyme S subunit